MAEKTNVPYDTISRESVPSLPFLRKCCCCIPLRFACFFMGYLKLCTNIVHTWYIVAFTTYFGLTTHGFDHFDDDEPTSTDSPYTTTGLPDDEKEQPMLAQVGIFLAVILIANVFWLVINIACLVGLHKKRPGPVRVYVRFACSRLVLEIIYLVMKYRADWDVIFIHCSNLAVTAYFVLVYHTYAVQLKRERKEATTHPIPASNVFVYPTLDKSQLVA